MSTALFIIDVQNDFTEGGALGVDGGAAVAAGVSRLLEERRGDYDHVLASRDWHSPHDDNGGHFALEGEPNFTTTWPVHCVAGTPGADYHPDFVTDAVDVHVRKGQGEPAYSIFEGYDEAGRPLPQVLDELGVTDVDVVGIATDHCVRASALDALRAGRRVRILTGYVAGVAPETSRAALAELERAGATLV